MKKILFALMTLLFAWSCTLDETEINDGVREITIDVDNGTFEVVGELREGVELGDKEVYISVPYTDATSVGLIVSNQSDEVLPEGLEFDSEVVTVTPGSGEARIYLKGTPARLEGYGDAYQIQTVYFSLTLYGVGTQWYIDTTANIKVSFEGYDNGVDFDANITTDGLGDVYKYALLDDEAYVSLGYEYGYGRMVTLSVVEPSTLSIKEGYDVVKSGDNFIATLDASGDKLQIKIPLEGNASATDFAIKLKVDYIDNDNISQTDNPASASDITVASQALVIGETVTLDGQWGASPKLLIPYDCGEERTVEVTVDFGTGSPLSVTQTSYVLDGCSGNIELVVDGTPDGDISADITVKHSDITDKVLAYSTELDVNNLTIYEVSYLAPYADSGSDATATQLEIKYAFGTINEEISLSALTGLETFVNYDLTLVPSQTLTATSGTLIFDLLPALQDGSLLGSEEYPSECTLKATFSYMSGEVEAGSQPTVSMKGFVWGGYHYNVLSTDDGRYWLDRNLEAETNECGTATYSSTGAMSGWDYNMKSFGAYYQRGRTTGIHLIDMTDGDSNQTATAPISDGSADQSWENGYWEEAPSSLAPANNGESTYTTLMDLYWNSGSTGGLYNPCPPGFRVPTRDELKNVMIAHYDTSDITTTGQVRVQMINGILRIPAAGQFNYATDGIAQVIPGVSGVAGTAGQIRLSTVDYLDYILGGTTTTYLYRVNVASGATAVYGTASEYPHSALPIRAIKNY